MKQTMTFACILAAAAFLATGCRPIPPEMIASQKDPAQLTAAKTIEAARVDYEFYLEALKIRAEYTGDARRYGWAKREKKNLTDSRPIEWKGLKVAPPRPGQRYVRGAHDQGPGASAVAACGRAAGRLRRRKRPVHRNVVRHDPAGGGTVLRRRQHPGLLRVRHVQDAQRRSSLPQRVSGPAVGGGRHFLYALLQGLPHRAIMARAHWVREKPFKEPHE